MTVEGTLEYRALTSALGQESIRVNGLAPKDPQSGEYIIPGNIAPGVHISQNPQGSILYIHHDDTSLANVAVVASEFDRSLAPGETVSQDSSNPFCITTTSGDCVQLALFSRAYQ